MSSFSFEPLRVTAHFRSNPVCDQWLPLDGILWSQLHRYLLGPEQAAQPGGTATELAREQMPLMIANPDSDAWYYACSWAQPQPWWSAEYIAYWNKRFDMRESGMVDFGKRRGKVIIEQGKYKAYHMPMFAKVALQVKWYCVGDRAYIERLLSCCTGIGKKRSQGYGRVSHWQAEPWAEDWSVWRDGNLTRGVPWDDVAEVGRPFDMMYYGVRPSYYRHKNQMPLAVPG
jgi:CRISPR type IV-associated protein Csf3